MSDFKHPERGALSSYDRYLAGMDASMKQKVALTAAHLLAEGSVADMGMGSGNGSHALAALYPGLKVIGVDVDPNMVTLAKDRYRLPNLDFVVGDIAEAVFPDGALEGIFDSSVLHHVTTFGGYEHDRAARALEIQTRELKVGGALIVRDFVDPGDGEVLLDLPTADGDASSDPKCCSTAALFLRFAGEFRSLSQKPGFPFSEVTGAEVPAGWRRFRLSRKLAAEFVLRKDYREDWVAEVKEEYTYFSQARFESVFAKLGLRVLASTPIWNPWIVRNRYRGKFVLRAADGSAIEDPPTNYLIVGEKVPAGQGVAFRGGPELPLSGYLERRHYRNRLTGRVMDVVRRPNVTMDVLPHFSSNGADYVLVRTSYPRPILSSALETDPSLDGAGKPGYLTEPLNVLQSDKPMGLTVEDGLAKLAGLSPEQLIAFRPGTTYYPSPGGVQEEVRSVLVEVEPAFLRKGEAGASGFSTSGSVRAVETRQVLRAAQVGGLPDARLELNVYELLLQLKRDPGQWIGEAVTLSGGPVAPASTTVSALLARPPRRAFEPARPEDSSGFLLVKRQEFEELGPDGATLFRQALEYVVPKPLSTNSVALALLWKSGGEVLLGVDDDDLPAAQGFNGNSQLLTAPAWRLPHEVKTLTPAKAWLGERVSREYGISVGEFFSLGGAYHPSPGVTPETVHPFAAEVQSLRPGGREIAWVPLRELLSERARIADGHLRVLVLRAAHALGLMGA